MSSRSLKRQWIAACEASWYQLGQMAGDVLWCNRRDIAGERRVTSEAVALGESQGLLERMLRPAK